MALSDLIASNGLRPQGFAATVTRAPASADDTLDVTWITLTGEVAGEQSVRWAGRGVLPAEGDDALLIMDSRGDPWAVCWPSGLTSDTAGSLAALDARLDAIEAGPEAVRYIGDTGQPAFVNGWVNFDNGLATPGGGTNRDAGFYRDRGRVHLTGLIRSGTMGDVAFTLPAGYRPVRQDAEFAVNSVNAFGVIAVLSTGVVLPSVGSNTWLFLNGVSFRHA